MPTNVRTDNNDLVTQYARGIVFQPADPVLLKPKGDPGVAPHFNISTSINNPAGTVYDHKTRVAHSESYMGRGKHLPIVIVGRKTGQVNGDNGFLSWAKTLYVEGRGAVMHGVQTGVNALWSMLPPALKNVVQNGGQVAGGMTTKDFADAAREDAEAMLDALKSTDTLIALAQTAAMMGVAAIPVVGQIAGGAMAVKRIMSAVEASAGAAEELKAMMERWSKPMSPTQIAAERKKLASFLIRVGVSVILAALGKAMGKLSARSTGKENSSKDVEVGKKGAPKRSSCACSIGDPVVIATGEKLLTNDDFSLPGPISIKWKRQYRSGDPHSGWFGQGWSTPFAVELGLSLDSLTYRDESGRAVRFPAIGNEGEYYDAYEQITVRHPSENKWEILFKNGVTQHFHRLQEDYFLLPLQSISDRNGNVIVLTYSEPPNDPFDAWRPHTIVDSAGRRLRLTWNDQAKLISVTALLEGGASSERLATYEYSAEGDLLAHIDAVGGRREYEWSNHMLTGYAQRNGARFRAEYDEFSTHGRVTKSYSLDDNSGLIFSYNDQARRTTVTDAIGRSTHYEYDERKDVVATIGPDGIRHETPYDSNGNPRGAPDPLGRQTHVRFDQRGNLTELVDPTGARTVLVYNGFDLPQTLIDALGATTRSEYDGRGNLIKSIDALGQVTLRTLNERGEIVAITDAKGGRSKLEWDTAGNLVTYIDCSANTTCFSYDELGRIVSRSDAVGNLTTYQWDLNNRLLERCEPDGAIHRYTWTPDGMLETYLDPLGELTRYRYDARNALLESVDANGYSLKYTYDLTGQLESLTNENGDTTYFHYDLAGQLTDEIGFDGRHQRYCYNSAGELTHLVEAGGSAVGPGKVQLLVRDARGRLIAKATETSPEPIATYRYDALGRLKQARNSAAELLFSHDAIGQLISESQILYEGAQASSARVLHHTYDPLGNRTRTALPDGNVINWLYYGSGHLHQINMECPAGGDGHIVSDMERDSLHREITRTQGALQSYYDYDPTGRLATHEVKLMGNIPGPVAASDRQYRYDPAGNLLSAIDQSRGLKDYRYDPVGRVVAATGSHPEFFEYDPAGNVFAPSQRNRAFASGNRIERYRDLIYTYDHYGNIVTRELSTDTTHFCWTIDNLLKSSSVTRNGLTQTTHYEYDPLGRRVRKSDSFGSSIFLWDGDLMIQSSRGSKDATYLFEPNSFVPLATLQNDEVYWYQCDQVGRPLELTDLGGNVAWAADYTVWGETQLLDGTTGGTNLVSKVNVTNCKLTQPFRFQGQQFDEETGLHYNRFRYFDPYAGRFISEDPIGLNGGVNLYVYAPNPNAWIDPWGLATSGQIGTYGSLNGGTNVGDNLDVHELVRHEALHQMGCAKKKTRNKDNPSIALDGTTHDQVHVHENALALKHLNVGVNQFQFGPDGYPSKQQLDVWQGAIRKGGVKAADARRLRKAAEKYLKKLCCC